MAPRSTYAAGTLVALGLLAATAGADLVGSRRSGLALAVGGSAVAWGSVLLLDGDSLGRWGSDERFAAICRRSGLAAWWLSLAVATTLLLSLDHLSRPVSATHALLAVVAVALLGYVGATAWYERAI